MDGVINNSRIADNHNDSMDDLQIERNEESDDKFTKSPKLTITRKSQMSVASGSKPNSVVNDISISPMYGNSSRNIESNLQSSQIVSFGNNNQSKSMQVQ